MKSTQTIEQSAIRNPNSAMVIALAGNPNAGKTTLFNALTGLKQKVANYPGVTVERKEGVWKVGETSARLIDLPGLYSLDATSLDEQIARDVLTGKVANLPKPDVIIAAVDATNLERNLYLVTQLFEYKIPVVVALTMVDVFEKQKHEIDAEKLSELLGAPVVSVTASSGRGIEKLAETVRTACVSGLVGVGKNNSLSTLTSPFTQAVLTDNAKIFARYNFISDVVQESVKHNDLAEHNFSERIDRVLTHKFFGLLILIAVLLLVFQTIFSWAELPMNLLESGFGTLGEFAKSNLPEGKIGRASCRERV